MRRSLEARVGFVATRFLGTWFSLARRPASLSKAMSRLRCCEEESCAITTTPEGGWKRRRADSVRFTCCPPGPLARKTSTTTSRSSVSRSVA